MKVLDEAVLKKSLKLISENQDYYEQGSADLKKTETRNARLSSLVKIILSKISSLNLFL